MKYGYAVSMRHVDPRDLPEQAISTFESATGTQVSCHDLGAMLWRFLDPRHWQHNHSVCLLVKRHRQGSCNTSCVDLVRCALRVSPQGLVKRCHAGLVEWVVPVIGDDGRIWAVLFAGARIAGKDLQIDSDEPSGAPGPWRRSAMDLQAVSEEQAAHILELFRQLAARLDLWRRTELPRLAGQVRTSRSRHDEIRTWIQQRHTEGVSLSSLSAHLGLSVDRTRHVVNECTGLGFVELLNGERLRTAADLLRRTDLPVREVVALSGFRNRAHFHQLFLARMGTTPAKWRSASAC